MLFCIDFAGMTRPCAHPARLVPANFGVLYCKCQVQGRIGLKGIPEDENVPVTFECLASKGVEETVAALRLLEGVEVGPCNCS
jgi:hypothetical protein